MNVVVTAVEDENVDTIDLYLNGVLVRREGTTPWDWAPSKGDLALDNLLPGIYELTATATTLTGGTYSVSSSFEIIPAAFRVTGISLLDTSDNTRVSGFDPMDDSAVVAINLDELAINTLSLVADYEGSVSSVRFTLNTNNNFNTDNSAPFTFTTTAGGAVQPWTLGPGEYDISATPFAGTNASGARGPGKTIQLRLERAILAVDRTDISLYASLASGTGAQSTLRISNSGNVAGAFTISNKPAWLNLSQLNGSVPAGGSVDIVLGTAACSAQSSQSGSFSFTPANSQSAINVNVSWTCDNRPEFDFVLERFYFNQAVPANDSLAGSEGENIEVIKGRPGLARVFVTRNNTTVTTLPQVTLTYRTAGGQTGSFVFEYPSSVPLTVNEGSQNASYNGLLPADFFQAGTEYYVEVDPGNVVPEFFENNNRYPESGYRALNIIDPPLMEIVFVPVAVGTGSPPALDEVRIVELMNRSEAMLPLEDYSFSIRAQSMTYSGTSWGEALGMVNDIRIAEDRNKFYHGLLASGIGSSNTSGIAYLSARAALSRTFSGTIAHEFGHNLSLSHTDCGGPSGPEPDYPHENARTGNWGFDVKTNELMAPTRADFMSYCGPNWIGSFNFKKMLDYRGGVRTAAGVALMSIPYATVISDPMLLTGSIVGDIADIDQAYEASGEFEIAYDAAYRIELIDENGELIYEAGFEPLEIDHEASLHFNIALPKEVLAAASEIVLLREDKVLAQTAWGHANATLKSTDGNAALTKTGIGAVVTRLDENRVEIQWPANGRKKLWVTDLETNNILTIDKTGRVIVHTQNDRLELKYLEPGLQAIEIIEL